MPKHNGPPRSSSRAPGPVIEAMEPRRIFSVAGAAEVLVPFATPVVVTDVPATPKPAVGADDDAKTDEVAMTDDGTSTDSGTATDEGTATDDGATVDDGGTIDDGSTDAGLPAEDGTPVADGTPADGVDAGEIRMTMFETAAIPDPSADEVPVEKSATGGGESDATDDATTVVDDAGGEADATPTDGSTDAPIDAPTDASADAGDVPVVAYETMADPSTAVPIETTVPIQTRFVPGVVERSVNAAPVVASVPPAKAAAVAAPIVPPIATPAGPAAPTSIDDLLAPAAKQKDDDLFPTAETTIIAI